MAGGGRKGKSGAVSSLGRRRLKIKKWNVVPAALRARNKTSTGGFFPGDMVNEILLRLPSSSCIVRFRCVCKLWNSLLSRPGSIHNILFTPDVKSTGNDEIAQVLIMGGADDNDYGDISVHFVYSLLSYKTLKLISPIDKDPDLPYVPNKVRSYAFPYESTLFDDAGDGRTLDFALDLSIVGSCDGIVCIANKLNCNASDIILWNPATSETKILPRSPFSGDRTGPDGRLFVEVIGFGFDPQTNDYKIIRSISADFITVGEFEPKPETWSLVEVYSLRNDSWRKTDRQYSPDFASNPVRCLHTYRGEMLYWWESNREDTYLVSCDLGKEKFDWIVFPNPTGKYGWVGHSFTLLKDSIVGVFNDCRAESRKKILSFEIRVLMKFDRSVAWTLLYSIPELADALNFSAIWRDGLYFVDSPNKTFRDVGLFTFDPKTGPVGELGIQDKIDPEIVTFVPSQISLSSFKVEDG